MDAIAAVYDAASDDEAFAALPDVLARLVGARSGIVQMFTADGALHDARYSYFTPDAIARYTDLELWRFDTWRGPCSQPDAVNRIMVVDEALPLQSYLASTFYNENFRYWGDDTAHCIAGMFSFESGFGMIGMHMGLGRPFEREAVAAVAPLASHLRRMFELRTRLGIAEAATALSRAGLDAIADAVWIVDGAGAPLLMNRAAETMLAAGPGLMLSRLGLRAAEDAGARRLADAISRACARVDGMGGAFSLDRPAGPPLRVLVSPLQVGHLTRALVVVNDPARPDPGRLAVLRGVYGLSVAEAEIAAALTQGLSPADVASLRGVTLTTVRTQIRQVLRKTDTRSLVDLAARVASIPAQRDQFRPT